MRKTAKRRSMDRVPRLRLGVLSLLFAFPSLAATPLVPLVRVVDLRIGESRQVELSDGSRTAVKLLGVEEIRDKVRSAIRSAKARVEIDGRPVTLSCGNYNLPVVFHGVRLDCTITKGCLANNRANVEPWGLDKDARVRLWPAQSPLIRPGTFVYPVKQKWFASATQMSNEPTFVDGGERPSLRSVYYHNGLDIGGAEALVEVVAATDGVVVSKGTEVLQGHKKDTPVNPRYDVIYIFDDRGWYYRYSHLYSFADSVQLGQRVTAGAKIGLLGKEGGSGGWSHLHFEIISRQPSGKWGTQEGYAFLWDAYLQQYKPGMIAVARPHHLIWAGDAVTLDGEKSWSRSGKIRRYDWTFTDGTTASGVRVKRSYAKPGVYSEILRVTDDRGRTGYDFAVVQVVEKQESTEETERVPPTIHPTYYPTMNLQPGDPVTFKVRSFRTTEGKETWNFGDGSPPVTVRSDGNVEKLAKDGYAVTTHRYEKPGDYIVRVERANERGETAIAHVHVKVGGGP